MDFSQVSAKLFSGIARVQEAIDSHLTPETRDQIIGPQLRALITTGTGKTIVSLALHTDALRVVFDALNADGEISDAELQESQVFLRVLAVKLARVRADYGPFAELQSGQVQSFLKKYQTDTGSFGYENASTKWAGIQVCRNLESDFGDNRPLSLFGQVLVEAVEALVEYDEVSDDERRFLEAIRQLCALKTAEHQLGEWFINSGYTMFRVRSQRVEMTVQPAVGHVGFSSIDSEEPTDSSGCPQGFRALESDEAKSLLKSLRRAIDAALEGDSLSLADMNWPYPTNDSSSSDDEREGEEDESEDDYEDQSDDSPEAENNNHDDGIVPIFDPSGWTLATSGEVPWNVLVESIGIARESSLVTDEEWKDAVASSRIVSVLHTGDGSSYVGKVGHTIAGEPGNYCRVIFNRSLPPEITITNVNIDDIDSDFTAAANAAHIEGKKLLEACRVGDAVSAASAIRRGADLKFEDDDAAFGKTPLLASIEKGNVELVRLLLDNGLPTDGEAWARSMIAGQYEIADMLAEHHFEVSPDYTLDLACQSGKCEVITRLAEKASINADWDNLTPLGIAAKHGQNEAIALLLKLGAKVDLKGRFGISPWVAATAAGHSESAELLQKAGATPEINEALIVACQTGNLRIMKALVKNGADVNARLEMGTGFWGTEVETPLLACFSRRHLLDDEGSNIDSYESMQRCCKALDFLLNSGADPNCVDARGFSALHKVALELARSWPETISLLVRHGADIEARDSNGDTPLMSAIEYDNRAIIFTLLKHGADPNSIDKKGNPAIFAMFRDFGGYNATSAKLLFAFGADMNARNAKGWSLQKRCRKEVDKTDREGGSQGAQELLDFLNDKAACQKWHNLMCKPIETMEQLVTACRLVDVFDEDPLPLIKDFIKLKRDDSAEGLRLLVGLDEKGVKQATLNAIEQHFGKELTPAAVINLIAECSFDEDENVRSVAALILANNAELSASILADQFVKAPLNAFTAEELLEYFPEQRSEVIAKLDAALPENPNQMIGVERIAAGRILSLKASLEAEKAPQLAIKDGEWAVKLNPSLQRSCWVLLAELKEANGDAALASALRLYNESRAADSWEQTRALLEESISADRTFPWAYNNIAWHLAAASDPAERNGIEAVEYAQKACELDGFRYWALLDTLAAAYAQKGDFDQAERWLTEAIAGCPEDTSEMQTVLERYRNQEVYPYPDSNEQDEDGEDDNFDDEEEYDDD